MFFLAFLLMPLAFATEGHRTIDNYVVKINGTTLIGVQSTEKSSRVLDLSCLGLQVLENCVFGNLDSLKNLNLSNNSISTIPERLFSKLKNLEHLNLANNNLGFFRYAFVGLDNLKTLNISNNQMKHLFDGVLFGLPKSSVIFTKGLPISLITNGVFDLTFQDFFLEQFYRNKTLKVDSNINEVSVNERKVRSSRTHISVKVCIQDEVLKLVQSVKKNETLPSHCRHFKVDKDDYKLSLDNLGISKFEKGWYQLKDDHDESVYTISLTGNNIVRITKEMLNDLPVSVINLARNKIERLENGIMDNKDIHTLELSSNSIRAIETGALAKMTGLRHLNLSNNLMKDIEFLTNMQTTIFAIHLERNKIAKLLPGLCSNNSRLHYLYLDGNQIQELKTDSLKGFSNLKSLRLSSNCISILEPGCFQQTPHLDSLDLSNNRITGFKKGLFDDLPILNTLNVGYNKLSNIKKSFPDPLPATLQKLNLDFNGIEELQRGTFRNVPKSYLSLDGNKISKIEKGSFDLPSLIDLSLNNNNLSEFDADAFQGLYYIRHLNLIANGITKIPKGLTENLPQLIRLKLEYNPIKELKNGDLYGFRKRYLSGYITLDQVPIELIEGGIFEDMLEKHPPSEVVYV